MGYDEQASFLDQGDKKAAQELIRNLFKIVQNIMSQSHITFAALVIIEGILQDRRSRAQHFKDIQLSYNKERKLDLLGILNSFISQSNVSQAGDHINLILHIAPIIIETLEFKQCEDEAKTFMNQLIQNVN